jgi:hypothetical protein
VWRSALPSPPVELSSRQPLLWAFLSPRLLSGCHHSCLPWPACLFTVCMRYCPYPTLWSSGHPALFATCLSFFFFQLFVYYWVCFFSLFFFPGWGHSVQGAMLIWPRVVCGSTACCLAHLVVCFSQAG